jgi:hypothetical protein
MLVPKAYWVLRKPPNELSDSQQTLRTPHGAGLSTPAAPKKTK